MKRPAILVVEENASVRQCIKKILLGKGYDVVEEPERNNALRACQIHQPDLVILGTSGIDTRDNVGIIHNIHIPDKQVPLFMISNATSAKHVVSLPRTEVNGSIRHLQPFKRLAADIERCL